jgi:hypothetical protein|nr:MAG TPA: hypothetical protein [Caudoviricetes sp.]
MSYVSDDVTMFMNHILQYNIAPMVRDHHGYLIGPGFSDYFVKHYPDKMHMMYNIVCNRIHDSTYKDIKNDGIGHALMYQNDAILPSNMEFLYGANRCYNYLYIPHMMEAINQSFIKWTAINHKTSTDYEDANDSQLFDLDDDLDCKIDGKEIIQIIVDSFNEATVYPIIDMDLYVHPSNLRYFDNKQLEYCVMRMIIERYTDLVVL